MFENQFFREVFPVIIAIVGLVATIIGVVVAITGLRDRFFPRIQLTVRQNIEKLRVREYDIKGLEKSLADVPAIRAVLINHGKLSVYPMSASILVDNRNISSAVLHQIGERPLAQNLEPNQPVIFAFYGQDIYKELSDVQKVQSKVELQVIITFEDGKTCKSNKLIALPKSLESNLEVWEFGF